jgi:Flp pilus assembly protein TadD
MPIRDVIFEHRMYLSLAAVVVLAVMAGYAALDWMARRFCWPDLWHRSVSIGLVVCLVVALGVLTLRRNEDYRTAVSLWADVAAKRPASCRAHFDLAWAHLEMGQPDQALIAARQALKIDPQHSAAAHTLGMALLETGELEQAIFYFERAVKLNNQQSWLHGDLGMAQLLTGQLDRAVVNIRKAIAINDHRSNYFSWLGTALHRQGQWKAAAAAYRASLAIDPEAPTTDHQKARELVFRTDQKNRYNVQAGLLFAQQSCWASDNPSPVMLDTLAVAYASAGRFADAQAITRQAIRKAIALNQRELEEQLRARLRLYRLRRTIRPETIAMKNEERTISN